MRASLFATIVVGATCGVAARGAADEPKTAAAKIDALVRGLESTDAATRARAALALGEEFPDGARAVPVLLDATTDDDAALRSAAITALRRLGRAGLEEAATQLSRLEADTVDTIAAVGATVDALGIAITLTDLAAGLASSAEQNRDSVRGMLWGLAGADFDFDWAPSDSTFFAITLPWLDAADRRLAAAAAATVAIAGRAAVADRSEAKPLAAEESPTSLAPLLSQARPTAQWTAWRLAAKSAPHGDAVATAILVGWRSRSPSPDVARRADPRDGPSRDSLPIAVLESALRSTGARASVVADEAVKRLELDSTVRGAELLWRLGAREVALARWRMLLERPDALRDRTGIVDVAQRIPAFLAELAPRLAGWIEEERSWSEALAALTTEGAVVPRNEGRSAVIGLSLCCLALQSQEPAVGESTKAVAGLAVRRALLEVDDRPVGFELLRRILRMGPAAVLLRPTLVEALARSVDDARSAALVQALATMGAVPSGAVPSLAKLVATPTDRIRDPDVLTRLRHHAGWPYVRAALHVRDLGFVAFASDRARLLAIDALGHVENDGRDAARAALKPLANDPDARVRYRVARALRRLGS